MREALGFACGLTLAYDLRFELLTGAIAARSVMRHWRRQK
jgi:hypothetical protein